MTRLFAFLLLIACALATMHGESNLMDPASGSMDLSVGGEGKGGEKDKGKGKKKGEDEIEIDLGSVRIKIIGSFSGEGKWDWQGSKPGENATVHQVTVGDMAADGKPKLSFEPPNLDAKPGDYVQFKFMAQNHTVTQSTFEKPCVKMPGGMDSGFMPNPNNSMPEPPSMMVAINDTKPLWFYCRQNGHCGKGMAMGINPGGEAKMTEFMNNAMAQNGTAANGTAGDNGLAANGTSAGNSTSQQNGLPESSAIASPTSTPLSNLVPGQGELSSSDGTDSCNCNCLCDLGQPGMGGFIGSLPLPGGGEGAVGKRVVKF